ncbi:MAG: hypothetical protein ACI9HK_005006 [Pirellulaceae bacterium]|jgi:hypothetical protein
MPSLSNSHILAIARIAVIRGDRHYDRVGSVKFSNESEVVRTIAALRNHSLANFAAKSNCGRDIISARIIHQHSMCIVSPCELVPLPIANPFSPLKASAQQPSSAARFRAPLSTAFWPLVPAASSGCRGVFSQTSTPWHFRYNSAAANWSFEPASFAAAVPLSLLCRYSVD